MMRGSFQTLFCTRVQKVLYLNKDAFCSGWKVSETIKITAQGVHVSNDAVLLWCYFSCQVLEDFAFIISYNYYGVNKSKKIFFKIIWLPQIIGKHFLLPSCHSQACAKRLFVVVLRQHLFFSRHSLYIHTILFHQIFKPVNCLKACSYSAFEVYSH